MQFQPQTSTKVVARDLVIPAVIGATFFLSRNVLTRTWCAVEPSPCVIDAVNRFDRIAFSFGSIQADFVSNIFQNVIGGALFLAPFALALRRRISFSNALIHSLGFLQGLLWNYAFMEIVRAFVQRPRPLVYRAPLTDGANVHQYTSFYSGHTSFAALATLSLYFYARRAAPQSHGLHNALLMMSGCFTVVMAGLRIVGGRHYPTDTIGGAIAGWAIAILIHRYLLRRDGK